MKINLKHCILMLIAIISISSGCKNEGTADSSPDPLIIKCWANAFEEESADGIKIFRPCATHTFPAARYRNTFTLNENNAAEYSVLAPNDAHTTAQGKWEYDAKSKKLRILDASGQVIDEYSVVELSDDVLRVK